MRRIQLLVAEDNYADVYWLKMLLDQMGVVYALSVVTDGESAKEFLLKRGQYEGTPDPDLILLDLNLPRLTGVDVLRQVPNSEKLPVCIMTGSSLEREAVQKEFGLRRLAYIIKPVERNKLLNCFRCYNHLWPIADELSR